MLDEKQPKGFALLTPARRAEIASMGGKSGAPENRHYSKNRKAAIASGRKGGKADHVSRGRKPASHATE